MENICVYAVCDDKGSAHAIFRVKGAAKSWCDRMNSSMPRKLYKVYPWAMPAKYFEMEN